MGGYPSDVNRGCVIGQLDNRTGRAGASSITEHRIFARCFVLILQGRGDCTNILNLETSFLLVPLQVLIKT